MSLRDRAPQPKRRRPGSGDLRDILAERLRGFGVPTYRELKDREVRAAVERRDRKKKGPE